MDWGGGGKVEMEMEMRVVSATLSGIPPCYNAYALAISTALKLGILSVSLKYCFDTISI